MNENKHPLAHAMGEIDDRYLLETERELAAVQKKAPKKAIHFAWQSLVAACLLLALILPLALNPTTVPDPSLDAYKDHPYYAVIKAIDHYSALYGSYTYKTDSDITIGDIPEIAPGATAPDNSNSGNEITDNQVEGVFEGDRIKRTDSHAFYLDHDGNLLLYKLDGETTEMIASFDPTPEKKYTNYTTREIYLTSGGKTLITVSLGYDYKNYCQKTRLSAYDVSDPESFDADRDRLADIVFDGGVAATRLTDGKLLVKIIYTPSGKPDYRTYNFIPHYETEGERVPIAPENITVPDAPCQPTFTALYLLDESLSVSASHALMGNSSAEYVTKDTIYLVSQTSDFLREDGTIKLFDNKYHVSEQKSTVVAIGYSAEGLTKKGSVTVKGTIKDQYSLDEYEGILRIAATTGQTQYIPVKNGDYAYSQMVFSSVNASLYCVSLESFEIIAAIENFAPAGESVRSARFDGTNAYICTAIRFTDPVYFFDLSDLSDITYTETGAIEGYSSSLIELEGGYLLGIGYATTNGTLKIEIYREQDGKVESVSQIIKEGVWFSEDYKSYFIDREAGLLGIGVHDFNDVNSLCHYLVFSLKDGTLSLVHDFALGNSGGDPALMRGFAYNGNFYVFVPNGGVHTQFMTN